MKIKTDLRLFAALGILAVLAIVPISSSVFAQSGTSENDMMLLTKKILTKENCKKR